MQNRLIVFILSIAFSLQFSASKNPSMHPVSVLAEQLILGQDIPLYNDERDLLAQRMEEHKIHQEEVHRRWDPRLEGLNLIKQPKSPVAAAETPRPIISLPLRVRTVIISETLLPIESCIETSAGLDERLEELNLKDRLPLTHSLPSVRTTTAATRVPLMNVCPTIRTVAKERNLSLSLPDDKESLWGIMSHVPVRSLEGSQGA